jgi:hypothetical protein
MSHGMHVIPPKLTSVYGHFRKILGPRSMDAGVRVSFHHGEASGVHFKINCGEYRDAIAKGIQDGMASRFPDFLKTGSVWITEITEHPVDSSQWAFYLAARSVIEQAYIISQVEYDPSVLK